ncbi:hypothetical protein P9112_005276 [Eukaryota sp. TZLM1-RC]
MSDPVLVLKEYYGQEDKQVRLEDDFIVFDEGSLARRVRRDAPSTFPKNEAGDVYQIDSIWLLWNLLKQQGETLMTSAYRRAAKQHNIEPLHILDRQWLVSFFTGKAEASSKLKPESSLPLEGLLYSAHGLESKYEAPYNEEAYIKGKEEWEELLKSVEMETCPFDDVSFDPDKQTVNNSFITINQERRPYSEEFAAITTDNLIEAPMSTEFLLDRNSNVVFSHHGVVNTYPLAKQAKDMISERTFENKENISKMPIQGWKQSRPYPIIIVPSILSAPLNFYNAQQFLEKYQYVVATQHQSDSKIKVVSAQYGGHTVKFQLMWDINQIQKENLLDSHVVAVVLFQPPADLCALFDTPQKRARFFSKHRGLYFKYQNQRRDPKLVGINVCEFTINTTRRHMDSKVAKDLWSEIFGFMRKKRPDLLP